jgi:ACS family D-galactonate transporter-like MFS transporter
MKAEHPTEFAIITTVDPADVAAVQANPTNPPPEALASVISSTAEAQGATAAEQKALSDVITNGELGAATVLQADPATAAALQANPLDPVAGAKAVTEVATALKVDAATAVTLLQGLPAALPTISQVQKYADDLTKAATTFTSDQLDYLKAHGAEVAKAAEDNAHQWQTWWWVCVAGQLVFIPFVFVLSGRWSPRRAKQDELEHEQRVQEELAALQGSTA